MPRPKRGRLATAVPTLAVKPTIPTANAAEKPPSPHVSNGDSTNSDDSDGLVTRKKGPATQSRREAQDFCMSGALVPEAGHPTTRTRPMAGRQRAVLARVARDADHTHAIEALRKRRDADRARAQAGEKEAVVPSSMAQVSKDRKNIEQARSHTERMEQQATEAVEVVHQIPPSAWKAQATPRAESTMIDLANFKRRSRQPSILHIGRRNESLSGTDLSASDLSDGLDNDFKPLDESTPLHVLKMQSARAHVRVESSSPPSISSSTGSRKRKRSEEQVLVPRSQTPQLQRVDAATDAFDFALEGGLDSEPESEPELPPLRPLQISSSEVCSDTMAPPVSSSPMRPTVLTSRRTDKSAPMKKESTVRRQPSRRPNTKFTTLDVRPVSTAMLQNLLPRRRQRQDRTAASAFDIPSSNSSERDIVPDDDDDEDELSRAAPSVKKRRAALSRQPKSRAALSRQPKSQPTTLNRPPAKSGRKGGPIVTRKAMPRAIYSRRSSDKENVSRGAGEEESLSLDSNDSLLPTPESVTTDKTPGRPTKELKTLATKFREVDRWEMDFEDITASSSSPKDAR